MRGTKLLTFIVALSLACVAAPAAVAGTGGTAYDNKAEKRAAKKKQRLRKIRSLPKATIGPDGLAIAPAAAPPQVHAAIAAANRIVGKPYKYGGGHARVEDSGYDCSGTVSYALIGAGLLKMPLDSGSFMRWGKRGRGAWFTVYTNPGHAYVVIAGLRLDTSAAGDPSGDKGPRWRPVLRKPRGFVKRHPAGF